MKFPMTISLAVLLVSAFALNANAEKSKKEQIEDAMKACGKPADDIPRLTKVFYLCAPGSKVDADGCTTDCLKKVEGAEAGKQ